MKRHNAASIQVQEQQITVTEPQAVIELLANADRENGHYRKWNSVLTLWLFVQASFITAFPNSPGTGVQYAVILFLMLSLMYSLIIVCRTSAALAGIEGLRMVGPLIDRLRSGSAAWRMRRVLKKALIRLLPRLKASDASLLTVGQKSELTRHLGQLAKFQRDKDFQVVILRSLQQIGDAQAIPVLEKIIQRKPRWSGQELVHKAAVECLPFLLARAEDDKTRNRLLRSASGFGGDTCDLLHPIGGGEGTDLRQLLRGDPQARL